MSGGCEMTGETPLVLGMAEAYSANHTVRHISTQQTVGGKLYVVIHFAGGSTLTAPVDPAAIASFRNGE